jgi:uncharacterized protein (TIGR00369 family)
MVRDSFSRGAILKVLETEMSRCEPGFIELRQPVTPVTLQHHGYVHGGVISTLMDIVGGHAAQTLMGAGDSVLTVEFKINMLAPGEGDFLRAEGHVIRPGKRITVCRMDLFAVKDGRETLICIGQGTYICMAGVSDAAMHAARTGSTAQEGS